MNAVELTPNGVATQPFPITISNIPDANTPCRKETFIKFLLQIPWPRDFMAGNFWKYLQLPAGMSTRGTAPSFPDQSHVNTLFLRLGAVCEHDLTQRVGPCERCVPQAPEVGLWDEQLFKISLRPVTSITRDPITIPVKLTCYSRHQGLGGTPSRYLVTFELVTATGLVVASGTTTPILIKDAHHVRPPVITATGASLPPAQVFSPSSSSAVSGVGPPYVMSPSADTSMEELVALPTPATEVAAVASLFSIDPPRIQRMTPSNGPISGGTEVTIHGGPFLDSDVCWFGCVMTTTTEILYGGQVMIVKTPAVDAPDSVPVCIARMNGNEELITSIEDGELGAFYQYVSSAGSESDYALSYLSQLLGQTNPIQIAQTVASLVASAHAHSSNNPQ